MVIGWSENHFNNRHFIGSFETEDVTKCAAEKSLRFYVCVVIV